MTGRTTWGLDNSWYRIDPWKWLEVQRMNRRYKKRSRNRG